LTAYSLLELNTYLKRVLVLNFEEPLWVRAEIMQAKTHRGHTYIDLVEKAADDEHVQAQASAILWSRQRKVLESKLNQNLDDWLTEGAEISFLVEVQFHEVHGLAFHVIDVDPAYTLGKLELQRQEALDKLRLEKLLDQNKKCQLPDVIQKLAVISSDAASGYQDFLQQLRENAFGYAFDLHLYSNAMQGLQTEKELSENLEQIRAQNYFDCVVLIRGGGSRIDLSAFDAYGVAREIAQCPIPVLTGIGHETDTTLADLVAHRAFKTPTAAAAFVVDRNAVYENTLLEKFHHVEQLTRYSLQRESLQLKNQENSLRYLPAEVWSRAQSELDRTKKVVDLLIDQRLNSEKSKIEKVATHLAALHHHSVLNRGYTLTTLEGRIVRSSAQIKKGNSIKTRFKDGVITSKVEAQHD